MSQQPWIRVNEKDYPHEALRKISVDNSQSDFEAATLGFFQQWVNGQQEFFIQTSGSTGYPKKIRLARSQMEGSARQTIAVLQLQPGMTSLVCLDTKYIAGQMMLVRSLMAGMNILALEPSANPFNKLQTYQIDFVALVPYQLEHILTYFPETLDQVRCAIIGGAAISASLNEKVKKSKCAIYATYGMTETLSHIALQRLNGPKPQDCFEALSSVDLRLDSRGCLCIRAEYLQKEIITNDLVELVEERKFRWLGRVDNVINSGGIKIIPEKVESVFESIFDKHEIKNRFFVAGLPHDQLGQQVTLIVEGNPFEKTVQEKILTLGRQKLSKYELPKEILFIPQFKETATGKINRTASLAALS